MHRMSAGWRLVVVAMVSLAAVQVRAAERGSVITDAAELRARGGLPNFFAKAAAGGEVRVAYIGGSITAANGWRPQTTRWLGEQYPKAKIIETDAAIGGTGSDLGVFRFRRDVLEKKPDLVFIEFAVNDGGAPREQILRCMEGMVRQAWKQDPKMDICFVYTLVDGMVPTLAQGKLPRSASAMEEVAEHYGIPSIHMGLEVVRLAGEGKMIMRADPKTAEEKAALAGKMIFSSDGVHPRAETGHRLYTEAVARSFKQMEKLGAAGAHEIRPALVADNYERAKLVPISAATLSDGFEKLDGQKGLGRQFARYMPEMYAARRAGQTLEFKFKGTYIGFMDLLGPDCGQVQVSVDGGAARTVARFDSFCTYHRIGSFVAAKGLAEGEHTVKVTTDGKMPDKSSVLSRLKPEEDRSRYEGTTWYAGWVMMVGE